VRGNTGGKTARVEEALRKAEPLEVKQHTEYGAIITGDIGGCLADPLLVLEHKSVDVITV